MTLEVGGNAENVAENLIEEEMASRQELFNALNIQKPMIGPILNEIYKREENQIWESDLFSSPHGNHWHTSFHSSSFPGDDSKACGRRAIYELMNIPDQKPLDHGVRLMGEVGKAIEDQLVWRFHRAGILLSNSPDEEFQTNFIDKEHWLSCSPDAIIKLPNGEPHLVEIKGKDPNVLEDMAQGNRTFDPNHRKQLLCQVGLTVENWPSETPCTGGTILYVARNRPGNIHEFRFSHNESFMEQGRAKLSEWKESYLDERLPARPKEWKWTEEPCKYCPVKRFCKADIKNNVEKLSESTTINHAKEVRGSYDYKKTRKHVLDRWK